MAQRLALCYHSLQDEEARRGGQPYAFVFRLRPDHLFLHPMAPVGTSLGAGLAPGRVWLYDDQMALARRADASAVLLAPSVVYSTCANAAEWTAACRAGGVGLPDGWTVQRCAKEVFVPCTAMALITVYGPARTWAELPWRPRSWEPWVSGDFCIKRARFVNESVAGTHEARCRELPGCMSC